MSKTLSKKLVLIAVALIVVISVMVIGYFGFYEMRKAQQTKEVQAFLSLNSKEFSSGDTLIITVHNNEPKINGRHIEFGQYYTIEHLREGEWKEAAWLYPWVWLDILYTLRPGESFNQSVELFPVREGSYRVSKDVKGHETTTLMETFEVVEGTPEEEIPEAELPVEFWEELEEFCNSDLPRVMAEKDIRLHLNNRISKAIGESDPEHRIFGAHGGGSQSVSIYMRHATKEFIEHWPKECHGVEIKIRVGSWALTEFHL